MNKYGIGDKVRIINYGHPMWESTPEGIKFTDMRPDIIGLTGLISKSERTQGFAKYAIDGVSMKYAWYNEDQLELVNKNPNNA